MTTTLTIPRQRVPEEVPFELPPTRVRRPRTGWPTPRRIRAMVVAVLALAAAVAALLAVEVGRQRDGLALIGDRSATEVVAASDLYVALNDMDAQLANVLLVGDEQGLGFTRRQALDLYEQRRRQADVDLQQAAAAAGDPATVQAVRDLLDGLGRYESLAGQTVLLDQAGHHAAGHPPAGALDLYRQAVDLLQSQVLPAAQRLADREAQTLDGTYADRRDEALTAAGAVAAAGAGLLLALGALQLYLVRRFRRLVNPALLLATLLALGLVGSGVVLLTDTAEHLRVAKKDAFDSVLALNRARAVSFDANADESRYLVDPARADRYQRDFLTKSQRLLELPGATLSSYDGDLAAALRRYRADQKDVAWQGFYGVEFRNITFAGERAAAEDVLGRYQTYQQDDRLIRARVARGQLNEAIALCTSYHPGDSNWAFDQYDQALAKLVQINQDAFTGAIRDGKGELSGWTWLPWVFAVLIGGLAVVGLRGRLAEYR
jgi:hypothetical protein